jgi:transcriptional regulator with XRE-family HTH domain
MRHFGQAVRHRREAAGLSLRRLAQRAGIDFGYLGQIERGERRCSPDWAEIIDRALGADGTLTQAYRAEHGGVEDPMQRRTVLRSLTALAAATASPTIALEALRHGLDHLADAGPDEWQAIAADYAFVFYTTPSSELVKQLSVDLTVLEHTLAGQPSTDLARAAGQLSVVMAMALASSHQIPLARRWWRTARRYADQSGDLDTRLWVRDWEVVNGTYEARPIRQILDLAEETIALAGDHICCGTAGVWAGRAQALAVAGHAEAAVAALHATADATDRMPTTVTADAESMLGWPEVRLRHTESFVYAHLGLTAEAFAAQDRALSLYPAELARERAQLQLHRASCVIRQGDIADGLRYAADTLDALPTDQHNALLYEVCRRVMHATPHSERQRTEYGELRERLAPPSAGL